MRRILTSLLFVASFAGSAFAADTVSGPSAWHGYLPQCDAPGVVARISEKFAYQDAHIGFTGLVIANVDGMRERAVSAGGPSLVDRRYCGATAWLSDGRQAEVVYLIEGPKLGIFSIGWHVESCVAGFDPFHVYDARCRSIRP